MLCLTCNSANPDTASFCGTCAAPLSPGISAPSSHLLTAGTRLQGGVYSIGKVLGQGGFGITYLGTDTRLRRLTAIKEFFPQGCLRQATTVQPSGALTLGDYQGARSKFLDEARVLAQFQHPGIVHVYTSFEENNTAYMVMEALRGKTLLTLVEERGPLPVSEAVGYIEKVGEALATVHQAKLLHRDIKPDNVIVTDDGRVVLLDFGTAREFATGNTRRMTAMLTPGYAPLEQYGQQARFGVFTDVYALGATFYHLLTGQIPVQATDRMMGVELQPPHRLNRAVPSAVSDAVVWAMQVPVQDRPQTVGEFLRALRGGVTPGATRSGTGAREARSRQTGARESSIPPRPSPNPYEGRIRQLLEEFGKPAPAPPPSTHDPRITELHRTLAQIGSVPQASLTQCPACQQATLQHVTGQLDGRCPLCRRAALVRRQFNREQCPVCRTGRLKDHSLPVDVPFCPVCRSVPLEKERRKQFGLAVDLWWVCRGCHAEFDVFTGGRAKLVRLQQDPHGMSRFTGQTLSVGEWKKLSERGDRYTGCTGCSAEFDQTTEDQATLVRVGADPHGTGARLRGKTLPHREWSKVALGLPSEAGEWGCPGCRGEFDYDPAAKTATLKSHHSNDPRAEQWRGKPVPLSTWAFTAAGKRSHHPGLLCPGCRTEFDESPRGLKLVGSGHPALARWTNGEASLPDWHRRARSLPTTLEEKGLREELARLEALRQGEQHHFHLSVQQRRAQLEVELSSACKQARLAGFIPVAHTAPNVRPRGRETVRWETQALKLKQRTQQGMPYWDSDGQGHLVITDERLLFDNGSPSVWWRTLSKVVGVEQQDVFGADAPVVVVWIDGVQKPVGFAVAKETFQVSIGSRTTSIIGTAEDVVQLLNALRQANT